MKTTNITLSVHQWQHEQNTCEHVPEWAWK